MLRPDDEAITAPIGFAIGGAVLLILVSGLLALAHEAGADSTASQEANLRNEASDLAALLAERPGDGWAGGADAVTRMGLQADNGSGLDADRIAAMKGASFDADPSNGKLDYAETLALLGLDATGSPELHLRVSPIGLTGSASAMDLSGVRTLYIGHYDGPDTSIDTLLATDGLMVADARAQLDASMSVAAEEERASLASVGLAFQDNVTLTGWDVDAVAPPAYREPLEDIVDAERLEGDVFPDQKQFLNAQVPLVIDDYEVVFIGSNVDHSALTSQAFRDAVEDYVHAGGMLIVLGSDDQSFQWLQSMAGTGIETANAGAFAPDVDHPLLREPHPLDWPAYDHFDQAWGGKSSGPNEFDTLFQHVISDGDGDVLAVSRDGAFGDGRIFLTTFRPYDIRDQIGSAEAQNFMHNMIAYQRHTGLYLDYGPAPPQDASIGAASRVSYMLDPELGQVPVRLTVLIW